MQRSPQKRSVSTSAVAAGGAPPSSRSGQLARSISSRVMATAHSRRRPPSSSSSASGSSPSGWTPSHFVFDPSWQLVYGKNHVVVKPVRADGRCCGSENHVKGCVNVRC